MNILAVSGDFSLGGLCYRFMRAGHDVRVYIDEDEYVKSFDGILNKVPDWRAELEWVGKDGLILFDTTGFGKIQDELRKEGYSVVGGSEMGDRCEDDRDYGQRVLAECGVKIADTRRFESPDQAIRHIEEYPAEWVIKKDGAASMIFNYIGQMSDGSDCIDVLTAYREHGTCDGLEAIILQQRIRGVEIGIARYFNGNEWVGPIEMNMEHKDLCDGGLGPKTWEMGTLMWFDENEENKLYQATLAKLEQYLKKSGFRGDIDINCIVNEEGIFPLEFTARFGFPALQLQNTLSVSPFEEFLKAVGSGEQYDFKYHKGYGVVVLVVVPPFPYDVDLGTDSLRGTKILFKEPLSDEEMDRINFEDVSRDTRGDYYLAEENGFALHVSGYGETVEAARKQAYDLIKKISIPKMFYRTDIGLKFIEEDRAQLKKWGYM